MKDGFDRLDGRAMPRVFPSSLQAIIFDFDRTLAPMGNFVAWRSALPEMRAAYLRHGVPERVLDEAPRGCFGLYGHVACVAPLRADALRAAQLEASEILASFEAAALGKVELFPGAEDLVRELASLGLKAGIVSSNPARHIRAILAGAGLESCFLAIVGRDGLSRIKPDPEGTRLCCSLLETRPENCLGVGDNIGDIEAATALGMGAVGVATGVSSREALLAAGAISVFDSLIELHQALRAQRG